MAKIKKTTTQPLKEFLLSLINIEAEFIAYGLKMRLKKKSLWQNYLDKGEKLNIPKIK